MVTGGRVPTMELQRSGKRGRKQWARSKTGIEGKIVSSFVEECGGVADKVGVRRSI